MQTLAKSALGVAVAAAVAATSVQASESLTMDPSLTFTYKNYYFDENNKGAGATSGHDWSHALIADFDTGYVNGLVGAVVTAGYAGPLDVDSGFATNVAGGSDDNQDDAISGFQQAYLKAQHSFSGVDFEGTVGVKKRSTETYSDSGSRILAASSTGYDLSVGFEGVNAYFTEITGVSERDASTLSGDFYGNGVKLDYLRIVGASYSYEGLDLAAEYGNSKDYAKQTFLKAGYGFELDDMSSVELDVRYGRVKSDQPFNDAKAKYYNLNATYNYDNAYVAFGYNNTKDGDYNSDYFDGEHDKFNSSLSLWEDYAEEGEKAYVLSAGYNFADQGFSGLTWDVWYGKGTDAKQINDFKRNEYGSYVNYAFDGALEGLSVAWFYTNYRARGDVQDNSTLGGLSDLDINRLYLTYSVAAF